MTHTKMWATIPTQDGEGTVMVRLPVAPPRPRGRLIWNSSLHGTYIRAKHGNIGYKKPPRSLRKAAARLRRRGLKRLGVRVPLG